MSLQHLDINKHINPKTQNTIKDIIRNHGQVFLVGGALRDLVLGFSYNDLDFEVYNMPFKLLIEIISLHNKEIFTNETFKTIKADKQEYALPRYELSKGIEYSEYELEIDINMDTKKAASRRDFTMNSIMYLFNNNTYVDHYNGLQDINNKIIKAVDYDKYIEDSIRVLRLLKYKFKLNFDVDKQTEILSIEMASNLKYQNNAFTIPIFNNIFKAAYFDASYLLKILHKLFSMKEYNVVYNMLKKVSFNDSMKARQVLFFSLLYMHQPLDNAILDLCVGKEKTKMEIRNTIAYYQQHPNEIKKINNYKDLKN